MNDDKTIIEKALAQTDAAIAQTKEFAEMCAKLIAEKENLVAHNVMLHHELKRLSYAFNFMRRCYGGLDGEGWDKDEEQAKAVLNVSRPHVDAWEAALIPAKRSTIHPN